MSLLSSGVGHVSNTIQNNTADKNSVSYRVSQHYSGVETEPDKNSVSYRVSQYYQTPEPEPTKRGVMDKIFGTMYYNGIIEGLYNVTDKDKDTTFFSGLGEGARYMNPFTNDVSGRVSFSDVLKNVGWEDKDPDKLSLSDVGRGVVGFAGDVLLDPMTYINPLGALSKVVKGTGTVIDVGGTLAKIAKADDVSKEVKTIAGGVNKTNLSHLKGLDRASAEKIVRESHSSQNLPDELVQKYTDELVESFNSKVLKIREGGEDFTIGFNNFPFANKIKIGDRTLDSFKKVIASSYQLRQLGDRTIAPYYNRLAKNLRTSRLGKKFTSHSDLVSMYDSDPLEAVKRFHTEVLAKGSTRILSDLSDMKIADDMQKWWDSLSAETKRDFWIDYESGKMYEAVELRKVEDEIRAKFGNVKSDIEYDKSYEAFAKFMSTVEDDMAKDSYKNVFRIFGKEMKNVSDAELGKYINLANKLNGVSYNDILRFHNYWDMTTTLNRDKNLGLKTTDKIKKFSKYLDDKSAAAKFDSLRLEEKEMLAKAFPNKATVENHNKIFDDILNNIDETRSVERDITGKINTLEYYKNKYGDDGLDIADVLIKRMNEIGQKEVELGRLKESRFEGLKNRYITHMRNVDMEEIKKALDNNGSFQPEVLGKQKDFDMSRKKASILALDKETGLPVYNTALHEVYLYRSLAHNKLVYSIDAQNFIKNNFFEKLENIEDLTSGNVPVVTYEELKESLKKHAIRTAIKNKIPASDIRKNMDALVDMAVSDFAKLGDNKWKVTYTPNIPLQKLNDAQFDFAKNTLGLNVSQTAEDILSRTNVLSRAQKIQLTNDTLNLYDRLLTIWKLQNTLIMPGFHFQNAVSNAFQSFLGISEDALNPKKLYRAYNVFKNPDPKQTIKINGKDWTYKELNYTATKLGVIDEMFHTFEFNRAGEGGMLKHVPSKADFTDVENFMPYQWGTKLGTAIEGTQRMNLFIAGLERGLSPEKAKDLVNKYLFDYSELTEFEQNTVKRIVPFYTFMRKNAPMELEAMLNNPTKFTAIEKGITDIEKMGGDYKGENERSEWRQEHIQIPNTGYGVANQLPYNQIERIVDPRKLAGQTTPLLKILHELPNQEYLYTDIGIGNGIEYLANQTAPTKVAYNTMKKDSTLEKILYGGGQIIGFPIGEI